MELKQQIANWKKTLLAPNKSDVLANLVEEKNAFRLAEPMDFEQKLSIPQRRLSNKLFKEHRQSVKESGTPVFGAGQHCIKFEFEGSTYCAPVFIANCSIKRNRYNNTYEIEQEEPFYINPLLDKILAIRREITTLEHFESLVNERGLSYSIETGQWCANFHPHRFILVKELERLEQLQSLSKNVLQIFGETASEKMSIPLHEGSLFNADDDQLKVFETAKNNNIVVQGPPGTGKSQVIANFMGKVLGSNQHALLVAEKKVALEVIYDQLKTHQLHHFCLLHHHQLNAKDFITSLKSTWKFLENHRNSGKSYIHRSKLVIDGLDLTLDRLRQDDLIGGVSFSAFMARFKQFNEKEIPFVASVPDIPAWNKEKVALHDLLEKTDDFKSWTYIRSHRDSGYIEDLEKALQRMSTLMEIIGSSAINKKAIGELMRKSGAAALFFYDDLLIPPAIFDQKSKEQQLFLKHYDRYLRIKEECEILQDEKLHWKKNFSLSELQEYIEILSNSNPFNLRSKFQRKKLMKFTDLNLNDARATLQNLVELKKKEKELVRVKQALRRLGISTDNRELEHIRYVIRKTQQLDENLMHSLVNCTHERLAHYRQLARQLNEFNQLVGHHLLIDDAEPIRPVVDRVSAALGEISMHSSSIAKISDRTKRICRRCSTVDAVEEIIYHSHWKRLKGRYPQIAQLKSDAVIERIKNVVALKNDEHEAFANHIKDRIHEKFEDYQSLLQIPARKLSAEKKMLKKELRKGKSILVKAFGKSRSFPSIHDLLETEAKKWIALLHPIFLCSPYTVAKSLPLSHQFDLVLFDEASQIPLPHAIGSLERSRRVVVAGDQQQMAPHFYFQKMDTTTHDLLHQASFYWENLMLTNHYRSSHERLIAYSNRYFYQNKLTPFPKPSNSKPVQVINAGGQFIQRTNQQEAAIAAEEIQQYLKSGIKDLGIVAFSQTQLDAILDQIPEQIRDELMDEDQPGFVQSLENVQGDQCSHLIISMGYAPNETGNFHMRFGPLNQAQGHRRLNVLMSRAKEKIIFIRSVTAADFDLSDNEGVEALRKLMLFLEEDHSSERHHFQPGIDVIAPSELKIHSPQHQFESANAMVNYYDVLTRRGWHIALELY
ncbi:MAG: DEAD/DEAH box helicase [Bacteroidota bacterium]